MKNSSYTKHHLKFGKNQADNLAYIGFRRRFFPVFYWCLVLAILASVILLSACGKMKTTDDLIKKAKKEIPVSDADSIDISLAGKCRNGSYSLLWFISGNEHQSHYYLPMECLETNEGCEFKQTFKLIDCGKDIAALCWRNGYAFLVNNTDCKTLKITDANGIHNIGINEYPFIWYNENIPSEYLFLDENNNDIT